jgi:hypothetical protein
MYDLWHFDVCPMTGSIMAQAGSDLGCRLPITGQRVVSTDLLPLKKLTFTPNKTRGFLYNIGLDLI